VLYLLNHRILQSFLGHGVSHIAVRRDAAGIGDCPGKQIGLFDHFVEEPELLGLLKRIEFAFECWGVR